MSYQIRQSSCSGCHMCRIHCPVQAISIKNQKYWIDAEKCIGCGSCVKVCHNGCISDPDRPVPVPEAHAAEEISCDVCVIGGGGSGMVAAARAADLGAKVLVLEKNHEIGGSAWYAMGFMCHYSKQHAAAGKQDPRPQIYETFMKKTQNQVNGKLLRRILAANTDWVDWLFDRHNLAEAYCYHADFPFAPMAIQRTVQCSWNSRRIDQTIGPGGAGWFMVCKMKEILGECGGEIRCNTKAVQLLTDGTGAVTGVLAEDPGGVLRISCKAVIVAAGAFTHNRKIMAKMQPMFYDDCKEPIHIFTCPTCTGDGITMCGEIGADIDYEHRRVNMFGPARHPYPAASLNTGDGPLFRSNGARYTESAAMAEVSPLAYDDKRYLYKITNRENIRRNIEHKQSMGTDENGMNLSTYLNDWEAILSQEEGILIAETPEALAGKLGFEPGQFARDLAAYNDSLGEKREAPPVFGDGESMPPSFSAGPEPLPLREGPFYAIRMKLFHENAVGGMAIDENMAVLKDGKPMQGLYACGDNVNGIMLPGDIGVQYIESVITALTFAFNSGFIAGGEAAGIAGCKTL